MPAGPQGDGLRPSVLGLRCSYIQSWFSPFRRLYAPQRKRMLGLSSFKRHSAKPTLFPIQFASAVETISIRQVTFSSPLSAYVFSLAAFLLLAPGSIGLAGAVPRIFEDGSLLARWAEVARYQA